VFSKVNKINNLTAIKTSGVLGLGLWCLTPLSTTCQLYHGGQIYWWRTPKYPEKTTTDLTQVTALLRPVKDRNIKQTTSYNYNLYGNSKSQ